MATISDCDPPRNGALQDGCLAGDDAFKAFILAGLRVAWLRARDRCREIEDVGVALASGCITPEQAAKHCIAAGLLPGD